LSASKVLTRSQEGHISILEHLRGHIQNGTYRPGDRLPTFTQLQADLCAASNTIDRAFAALEREGLVVRRRGSGVYVAEPQRRITGNVGVLGFHFNDHHRHPYWLHLMRGMQEAAQKASLELLILNPEVEAISWEKVDGVLIYGGHPDLLQSLPPHMPSVALVHRIPQTLNIVADEYQGLYDATRHLLKLGHRRVAIVSGSELRLAGYRAALQDAGVKPHAEWIYPAFIPNPGQSDYRIVGYVTTERWLKEPSTPWTTNSTGCTALLAHNDDFAIGAIEALRDSGRSVPDDVSVVGFDGTEVTRYFAPQLSTVEMPLVEIGRLGMESLRNWIDGETPALQTISLPAVFKAGESSAPATVKSKSSGQRPHENNRKLK
jgi:DNA-binding LacI/PurR family transcriptional regulator